MSSTQADHAYRIRRDEPDEREDEVYGEDEEADEFYNTDGQFGRWTFAMARRPEVVRALLDRA